MKLFLQGTPGCGKSTAIQKAIENHRDLAAGFMTSRVFSSKGKLRGFAQFGICDDVPLEIISDAVLPSQFLEFDEEGKCCFHRDVLEKNILKFIRNAETDLKNNKKKFAVLDEIGGYELNDEEVFSDVKNLLFSEYSCIGVIKEAEHAKELLDGGRIMEPCYVKYTELIEFMKSRDDIIIADVDKYNADEVMRSWADTIF